MSVQFLHDYSQIQLSINPWGIMRTIFVALSCVLILAACRPASDLSTFSETESSDELSIAIAKPLAQETAAFLNSLTKGSAISLLDLDRGAASINGRISAPVRFGNLQGSSVRLRDRYRNRPGLNPDWSYDVYRGVKLGSRVFIYKLANQEAFRVNDSWRLHSWVAGSILNEPINGKYTATDDQVKYYLEAKIYEPRRIAAMNKFLDNVEFAARFIPGYAGLENAAFGETTGQRVLGVVQIIGDFATLGIGTSVKVVSRTAAVITITAASTRVGVAGYKYANGTATSADGIDAFLATVEAGIAAISIVKVKLTSTKAIVRNADEAALLSKQLGRPAEDIMKNGLSKAELKKLLGDIPELRKMQGASSSIDDLARLGNFDDIEKALGRKLTDAQKKALNEIHAPGSGFGPEGNGSVFQGNTFDQNSAIARRLRTDPVTGEEIFSADEVRYLMENGYAGNRFGKMTGGSRNSFFGLENKRDFKQFKSYWERSGKRVYGRDIQDRFDAEELYQEWVDIGRPRSY